MTEAAGAKSLIQDNNPEDDDSKMDFMSISVLPKRETDAERQTDRRKLTGRDETSARGAEHRPSRTRDSMGTL